MRIDNNSDECSENTIEKYSLCHVIKSAVKAIKNAEHHPQVTNLKGSVDNKTANDYPKE